MDKLACEEFPLFFSNNFSKNDFQIIEAPEELFNKMLENQVVIKANMCSDDPKKATAAFVSDDSTYQIQKLESSNTYYLCTNEKEEGCSNSPITIHCSQNSVLTCSKLKPNKVIIESLLRENTINELKAEVIDSLGITFYDLLSKLQISSIELESVLSQLCPLKIGKKYYKVDESFMFDIGSKLIILYVDSDLKSRNLITLQSFIDVNQEKQALDDDIFNGYGLNVLVNILSQIFDLKHEDENLTESVFQKNINKVKVFCARSILNEKDSYYIDEFMEIISTTFDIVLEEDAIKDFEASNKTLVPKNNLIEGLPKIDLSFLKSYSTIILKESMIEKDHIIQSVDYYSLGSTIKERINNLDSIKKKWTKSELTTFCSEFLDDYKNDINIFLSKEYKLVKERNPFDVEKEIFLYIKKY